MVCLVEGKEPLSLTANHRHALKRPTILIIPVTLTSLFEKVESGPTRVHRQNKLSASSLANLRPVTESG